MGFTGKPLKFQMQNEKSGFSPGFFPGNYIEQNGIFRFNFRQELQEVTHWDLHRKTH